MTLKEMISAQTRRMAARSPWIYRINAGSCNGCDVECATTALIPRYDVERLGCQYCGSPRHADIVLITGPLTARVKDSVLRVYNEVPEPKVTVAVGVCPISGGIFRDMTIHDFDTHPGVQHGNHFGQFSTPDCLHQFGMGAHFDSPSGQVYGFNTSF